MPTVSERIIQCMSFGMTLPQAIDHVLGAGAYQTAAGAMYDLLADG